MWTEANVPRHPSRADFGVATFVSHRPSLLPGNFIRHGEQVCPGGQARNKTGPIERITMTNATITEREDSRGRGPGLAVLLKSTKFLG